MVSKIESATRQLEQSLKLFFEYGDEISIHTLGAAAHQVFHDICERKGIESLWSGLSIVREDKRAEVRKSLREPQNFFKHASEKGEEDTAIEFIPEMTEYLLHDACELHGKLTGERLPLLELYRAWFYAKYPDILEDEERQKQIMLLLASLGSDRREVFLNALPMFSRTLREIDNSSGVSLSPLRGVK